jgi:hypothetical protein
MFKKGHVTVLAMRMEALGCAMTGAMQGTGHCLLSALLGDRPRSQMAVLL